MPDIHWKSRVDARIMALTLHFAAVTTINLKQNNPCIFYCLLDNYQIRKNIILNESRYKNLLCISNIPGTDLLVLYGKEDKSHILFFSLIDLEAEGENEKLFAYLENKIIIIIIMVVWAVVFRIRIIMI